MPHPADLPPIAGAVAAAEAAATAHVGACSQWLYESEELPVDEWPESPAVGPFDGCDTCVVREALAAAWPAWLAAVLAQLRTCGEGDTTVAADLLERVAAEHAPPIPAPPAD
jgi:hypothetical protein